MRRRTGSTASTSPRRWHRKPLPPRPAPWALRGAIPWPCFPSADTTWRTISGTGCEMGSRIPHPPKIFHVNWFRKGADGKFLWPGYGENVRVLKWMLERIEGRAAATETPIGIVPDAGRADSRRARCDSRDDGGTAERRSRRVDEGARRSRGISSRNSASACPPKSATSTTGWASVCNMSQRAPNSSGEPGTGCNFRPGAFGWRVTAQSPAGRRRHEIPGRLAG